MRFQPRLWPSLLASVVIALGVAAGQWQTGRAEQKLALKATIAAAALQPPLRIDALASKPSDSTEWTPLQFRTVTASGRWLSDATVFLDNRVRDGVPGYHVLTPLDLGGQVLLVNRGWAPASRDRNQRPAVVTPAGPVTVQGEIRIPMKKAFALGVLSSPDGRVWQQIRLEAMAQAMKQPLAPVVIFQTGAPGSSPNGLVRQWDAPDFGVDTHRGYAFQWYALATLAFIFFLVMSIRIKRHEN